MAVPTTIKPAYDLPALREKFQPAREGIAYLNHAGISPLAEPVKRAIVEMTEKMARLNDPGLEELFASLKQEVLIAVGKLVNASPEEVALVQNTSTGLNLIAHGLQLKPGDNVLLCDVEFPSNVYPWMNLARDGVETRLVPAQDGGLTLDGLEAHRDARSRLVAVSAVQFFTGRHEDLAALGTYCAEHGLWLVVDAIQGAGVVPIDMRDMGIHAVVAGGQKALLGPPGQGFLVIRSDLLETLTPVFVGPLSVVGWEHWLHYDLTLNPGARRFDLGTYNLIGMAGLLAAIDLLLELGVEHVNSWVTHLADLAIADLSARGYAVITPERHAHIVTFAPNGDADRIVAHLKDRGIHIASRRDATGKPHLRISAHCYNTEDEVLQVGAELEELRGKML